MLPRLTSHRLAFQLQHSQTSRTLPDAKARKIALRQYRQLCSGLHLIVAPTDRLRGNVFTEFYRYLQSYGVVRVGPPHSLSLK